MKMVPKLAIFLTISAFFGTVLAANVCEEAGLVTSDGLIPHPTNCSMYISCYVGQPYEFACPEGYYFNPSSSKCDPRYVCPVNTCPETGVVYQPVNGSCVDYVLCVGGTAYPQVCEDGLSFDPTALKCIPDAEAQCVPNQCDSSQPHPQLYVSPFNCTIYFVCDENFEPVEFECAAGTIFDETAKDCILGDTCPGDETTTTTEATTTTTEETSTTTAADVTTTTESTTTTTEETSTTTEETSTVTEETSTTTEAP
ncbi:uncharacterized protein LOC134226259 [Armigeres subalbatus]|uniref:uncharacterized protein LOC134226259 n=1 Tax=Armigeres subalbatus TaxID=124917 RepID=UPI002ED65CBD